MEELNKAQVETEDQTIKDSNVSIAIIIKIRLKYHLLHYKIYLQAILK